MAEEKNGFSLCTTCAARQGTRDGGFGVGDGRSCFICRGLTSDIPAVGDRVLHKVAGFQFKTFSVGIILPPGVQEREDQLRSDLRIRGLATVKSELAAEISALVGKRMRKKVDKLHPELTILVNLDENVVEIIAKSVFIYGKYTKPRGLPQRRTLCEKCEGRGCDECDDGYAKTTSVETFVGDRFLKLLRASRVKFTWLGSEDADSLVLSPGRPFVLEVKNPMKHTIPARMALRTGKGLLKVSALKRLPGKPTSIPSFAFTTRAFVESEVPIGLVVSELKKLSDTVVHYRNNKGKNVEKKVHSVKVVTSKGKKLTVDIKLDGGLPVKRLVNGDSVSPSLSEVLKTPLKCQRFDILRVWESRGFEFGKV